MEYLPRLIEQRLAADLAEIPAVLLTGPRASGKTTTARRFARTVVQLDDPSVGDVFRQAPDIALRDLERPVLLDEWQNAPEVIGAIKRSVDRDPRPGQFLLTGSPAADMAGTTWPGTGRVIRLAMTTLTERELRQQTLGPSFIDTVVTEPERLLGGAFELDLADYIDIALRSGFPVAALRLGPAGRTDWLDSYLEECFSHDIPALRAVRDPDRLRRLFSAIAANTAGVVDDKTLHDAARLDRKTAVAFEGLFTTVGIATQIPAFTANRVKRLVERPKRYVTDAGLVGATLGVDRPAVLRDSSLLGRLVDTFVLSQLRAELTNVQSPNRPRLHHLRTEAGRHEVDIIVDLGSRGIVAIEVKAAGAATRHDARHLQWLQAELGDQVAASIVMHTGASGYPLADNIFALPIAALFGPPTTSDSARFE